MLAQRTTFSKALTDIAERHRSYREKLTGDDPELSNLSLMYPTFMCEVKLDGERMVVHMNRGTVTMQVRQEC